MIETFFPAAVFTKTTLADIKDVCAAGFQKKRSLTVVSMDTTCYQLQLVKRNCVETED